MSVLLETAQSAQPTTSEREKIPGWKWAVVWTMFLATMLNYMDRNTMGSTSSYVIQKFDLGETGYGKIEFWFGLAFAITQFPAGYMADKFSLRWVYAISLLIWSAAGFMTGVVDTFTGLLICRVILGIGESFNWPCAVGVVRRIIPPESRSFANGIFHGGASVGAAITPLLAIAMIGKGGAGWQHLFMVVGALGLLWAVLWFALVRGKHAEAVSQRNEENDGTKLEGADRPFIHVFKMRTFWIALLYGLAVNITWHFYRAWLPRLLQREHGLDPKDTLQYVLAGFYIAADLGSVITGWTCRRLVRSGMSIANARKIAMFGTAALCLLSWPAATTHDTRLAIVLFFIVAMGAMGGFASFFSMSQEISAAHTSRCLGVLGAASWFAVSFMHRGIGVFVDQSNTFVPLLIIAGFIPLVGAIIGIWWPSQSTEKTVAVMER